MFHKSGEHQSLNTSLYVSLDISKYVHMCVHVDYILLYRFPYICPQYELIIHTNHTLLTYPSISREVVGSSSKLPNQSLDWLSLLDF